MPVTPVVEAIQNVDLAILPDHYTGGEASFPAVVIDNGGIRSRDYTPAEVTKENVTSALHDINNTYTVLKDPDTRMRVGVALAYPGASPTVTAEFATSASSIPTNHNNATEFAINAAGKPDQTRLYVDAISNGGTSTWLSEKERRHFVETGRYTWDVDGITMPMPTIRAMERAIHYGGIAINRVAGNVSGAALATGYMAAAAINEIHGASFKGRPNVSDLSKLTVFLGIPIGEFLINARSNRGKSQDPWRLTDEMKSLTEEIIDFERLNDQAGASELSRTDIAKAHTRGPVKGGLPAVRDTLAAYDRQPNVFSTFIFPNRDIQYRSRADIANFVGEIALHPSVEKHTPPDAALSLGRITVVMAVGTHHGHTHAPSAYRAFEQAALAKRGNIQECREDGRRRRFWMGLRSKAYRMTRA